MKVKTAELTDLALDWAVATAEGRTPSVHYYSQAKDACFILMQTGVYRTVCAFGSEWAQGGPIIERERMDINYDPGEKMWTAHHFATDEYSVQWGDTPLIAAMRCYVASKLGDEVDVPEGVL
jgi:hypothetical protein